MLKIIRKKGVIKKVLYVLTFVIVISFGFWGTAVRYNTPSLDYAGKIFGRKISFDQFEESQLHTRNQAILRYGEEFNKISQFLNLDAETWDRLILLHEANRRGLHIPDKDVVHTIGEYPFFQRDGKFDDLLYNDILRYVFRCKPRDFEEGIRETLMFSKLYEQETKSITASDEEILEAYKKEKEKVQVSYILFPSEIYKKDIKADDLEIQNFYAQRKDTFRIPPTINVEYLKLILPENIAKQEKDKLQEKINLVSDDLKTTPDLKTVGSKYGIPVEESGFFSQEQPNLKIGWSYELLKKAFEMSEGAISQPIETEQGFYILKLKEKKNSYIPEFAEVQEKVREAVLMEKAKQISKTTAQENLKTIKEGFKNTPAKKLNDLAAGLNMSVSQTPFFSKGEYLPTLGMAKDFQDAAFDLNEQNKISDVVETPKGFCILYFDGKEPLNQENFQKEKTEFTQSFLNDKKKEAFDDFLAVLRIKANLQDNISKLKAKKTKAGAQ